MARSGIYVNGKEIVARYVGDKLVWKKKQLILLAEYYTIAPSGDPDDKQLYHQGVDVYHVPRGTYRDVTVYIDDEKFIVPIYKVVVLNYERNVEFHFLSSYVASLFNREFDGFEYGKQHKVQLYYKK